MKRLPVLAIVGTLTLGGGASLVMSSPSGAKAKTTHKHKAKPKPKVTTTTVPKLPSPHIGQTAKDGKFAFKITGVQCGVATLGSDDVTKTAPPGSSWCLATMTVKAYQNQDQTFFITNQKAIDRKGRQLAADPDSFYIPADQDVDDDDVNPGITITAVVPFQVATGDTISKFILHDSAFSGGVTVYNVG